MSYTNKVICTIECYWDRILIVLLTLLTLSILAAIAFYFYLTDWRHTVLRDIQARGELVVVTRNAPTTYYEDQSGEYAGLEHDLVQAFAEYLGVKVRFVVAETRGEVLGHLDLRQAHLAAAGLAMSGTEQGRYRLGPAYQTVHEVLVCRRNHKKVPTTIEELRGRNLVVPQDSRYVSRLQQLQREHRWLVWEEDAEVDSEQLLWKVWRRKIDCTVSDSNILAINQRYYPELVEAFDLNDYTSLAWVMPENGAHLQAVLEEWLDNFIDAGGLDDLMERYYGHLQSFDYVDTRRFRNAVYRILPKYRKWFQAAARKHSLDWRLLAAVAYQESHWNPKARSPTGVRGIMMLTQPTARQLGVENRLDARSNIYAGATYLAQLRDRLPASVEEPERTWMVLAAYNMGYGHLDDARMLAERLGRDPNRWIDVQEILPLLSQRKYYKYLRHGYARSFEAVQYVDRVRVYHDILLQNGNKKRR